FNRRFSPAVQKLRARLAGRSAPIVANYRMNAGYIPLDHWVHGPHGGGRNIREDCHIYHLFAFLTESDPGEVHARTVVSQSVRWRRDDNFVATIHYADGSVCSLTYTSMGSRDFAKESCDIFVDGKVLTLDDYKRLIVAGGKGGWKSMTMEKGQREELEALGAALKQGKSWPISLAD